MFLSEKRNGTVKGRMVYDGSKTRGWHDREDTASPTASYESIILTAMIDSFEDRDVMIADVPNAFIQALLPDNDKAGERVVLQITGVLVDLLVKIAPEVYGPFVVIDKNGKRTLYLQVLRALYGMLVAAMLWYKTLRKDLEEIGFVFNPYDACVANRTVEGTQHTIKFHVDDMWSSHKHRSVNIKFKKWLNEKYGKYGEVTADHSRYFNYLGVNYDLREKGVLTVSYTHLTLPTKA